MAEWEQGATVLSILVTEASPPEEVVLRVSEQLRVIIIAVGGATCSGKTTLAKHLRSCLPDSFIIHQDDFAPPQELVPIHPVHGVQDWDDAPGAIDWPFLASALQNVRLTGLLPASHRSHDHLNEQRLLPVEEDVIIRWRKESERVKKVCEERGERIVWAIADGFLLYWSQAVVEQLDLRVFLRVPHDVLARRRHERYGYYTAVQSDHLEGALWRDPPQYWEHIVYPAYVRANRDLFEAEDVEKGGLSARGKAMGLMLFEGQTMALYDMLGKVMEKALKIAEDSLTEV